MLKAPFVMDDNPNRLLTGGVTREVFRLALPALVGALLQNLQSIIDLYWVGYLGKEAVAAVAMSGTILMLVMPLIMGACTGTVALVARAIGEGRKDEAERVAGEAWRLALLMGLVTGIAGVLLAVPLARLIGAQGTVLVMCRQYLTVMCAGAFMAFLLFTSNSILRGAGNTFIPMVVMIISNVVNIFLDPILIFGNFGIPAMGIQGAAVATVVATTIAGIIVFYLLKRGREGIKMRIQPVHAGLVRRLMKIGLPGSGQMLSRSLMALVIMKITAGFGVAPTAAYGIGIRILMLLLMPSFAIANAVATMVGQNLGAGMPHRAAKAAWRASFANAAFMIVVAALLWTSGGWIAARFTQAEEVQLLCVQFLRTVAPFYVFVALAIVLQRAMMGAGDTVPPFITTVFCLWGLQVPMALLLPRYFQVPVHGVWWAMSIAVTVHGLIAAAIFATGHWKKKKV